MSFARPFSSCVRTDAGMLAQVNSLHPGNIHTSLTRGPVASYGFFGVRSRPLSYTLFRPRSVLTFPLSAQKLMQSISSYAAMTPFEGAKTQLYLAASPEVSEKDYRCAPSSPSLPFGADERGEQREVLRPRRHARHSFGLCAGPRACGAVMEVVGGGDQEGGPAGERMREDEYGRRSDPFVVFRRDFVRTPGRFSLLQLSTLTYSRLP